METDFTTIRHKVEQALDSCGIGSDIQDRLGTALERISALTHELEAAAMRQAIYHAMTNRPQGITNDGPGTSDGDRAFVVGAVATLSHLVEWDIFDTRRLAANLLEDVNDHDKAAIVQGWADNGD